MSREHTYLLRQAVTDHLGAINASVVSASGDEYLVTSRDTDWLARPVTTLSTLPATLFELSPLPEAVGLMSALPVVALLADGSSFLLNSSKGFAEFAQTVVGHTPPDVLARLVTHFWGRGMERVVTSPDELTEPALTALRLANTEVLPPQLSRSASGWELRFLAAAASGGASAKEVPYDIREWTVRGLIEDGVEWQVRPITVRVPGAVRG
jgi:hypothetical protein